MALMTTRTIASAAERALSTMYLWGHIQGAPSVDRRIAMSDMIFKDGSGNVGIGTTAPVTRGNLVTNAGAGDVVGMTLNNPHSYGAGVGAASVGLRFARSPSNGGSSGIQAEIFGGNTDETTSTTGYLSFRVRNGGPEVTTEYLRILAPGHIASGVDNAQTFGTATKRWSVIYAGTGTINTSDERAKTEIGNIPDDWLDAWGDVQWQRFKFVDGNRWHVGLIAQAVHAAFAGHGLDAFDIGLCCYDEWQEERAPIFETVTKTRLITVIEQEPAGEDENGQALFRMREVEVEEEYQETIDTGETRVTLEAGDRWGLRYDECQAIEAAWNRRELARMAARLTALESPAS